MQEWCPILKKKCFPVLKKKHLQQPQTKAVQSCSVRHNRRGKAVTVVPPPQQTTRKGLKWLTARQQEGSAFLFCVSLPVVPLVSISPHHFSSVHKRWRKKAALPQVALVLRVHGSACLAAKVLWEVAGVGYGADDSEPGRAVRIRDDALVRAFRRPGGAPYLQQRCTDTTQEEWLSSAEPTAMNIHWSLGVKELTQMDWHLMTY